MQSNPNARIKMGHGNNGNQLVCRSRRGARPWFVVAAPDSQVKHISELRTQHVVWLVVLENYVLLRGKFGCRLGDKSCQQVCLLDTNWYSGFMLLLQFSVET